MPTWTPAVERGLRRLGRLDKGRTTYGRIAAAYAEVRKLASELTGADVDRFCGLVAAMPGRELPDAEPDAAAEVEALVRQVRSRSPLRARLRTRSAQLAAARAAVERGLAQHDAAPVRAAVAALLDRPDRSPADEVHDEPLLHWTSMLWRAEEPDAVLAEVWGAGALLGGGLVLPAAVLHLRDAKAYPLWDDASRSGYAALADGFAGVPTPAESYRLYRDGTAALGERFRVHPLEVYDVLTLAAPVAEPVDDAHRFRGFCGDGFAFLGELAANNQRSWMDGQRERYRFGVREPVAELCRALAARYVEPVLVRGRGWDLETTPRTAGAVSSITKNDFGRSSPYKAELSVAFVRRGKSKADDVQLLVRVDPAGVEYGLHLGPRAREAGRTFRRNVQEHGEALFRALHASGALSDAVFAADGGSAKPVTTPAELRAWAAGKTLFAGKRAAPDAELLRSDDFVGEVLLTFDRLLPAYACAVEADPRAHLGPAVAVAGSFDAEAFAAATHLGKSWLDRTVNLLGIKKQLILQGVPGTGKTHVARSLARLLTGDRPDAVRLVQFHPAYSYEEFVEGIKARTVEDDGRHDVTYPVEDGVLCAFAAQAAARPDEPHVLVIDEVNRGNLPRVFGELLFLLEYRDQEVTLPYSKRLFRLPANLILLGTMNAADRSAAGLDQALRRRFSFVEMPPDAAVLAAWLERNPPAAGPGFARRVAACSRS